MNNLDTVANNESNNILANDMQSNEVFEGTMQSILIKNIGNFASVDFLIGTNEMIRKEGIIYSVGVSYMVLHNEKDGIYTVCDIYSIKFVNFFDINTSISPRSRTMMNKSSTFVK